MRIKDLTPYNRQELRILGNILIEENPCRTQQITHGAFFVNINPPTNNCEIFYKGEQLLEAPTVVGLINQIRAYAN